MAKETLRFEKFHVWQVIVPARTDILSAPTGDAPVYTGSVTWPALPVHLVEGVTSAGFIAVGEAGRGTQRKTVEATLRDLLAHDLRMVTPATIWQQPHEANGLPAAYPLRSWEVKSDKSYELMESLWLDATGKAADIPVSQLLGGAVRQSVTTDFWANRPAAETLIALIHEAANLGLTGMKMKCNYIGDTVHALQTVAMDIPDGFRFTIDPMCAWRSMRETVQFFEILANLPFAIQIEDPFPYRAVDDWQSARRNFPQLTIACHTRTEDVLQLALQTNLADTYNLGGGSAYNFLRVAQIAEFSHKDCWHGSSLELGVLQHVRLHAAACARNCLLPSDLQSEWVREQTLITPRMSYRGNQAVVPVAPGLGIDLDHQAMKPYIIQAFTVER